MNVHVARSVDEACALLADNPEAQVLAGGTDFMVEVNYRHRSPSAVVAINRVPETSGWSVERNQVEWNGGRGDDTAETIRLGATLTFAEMEDPAFVNLLPALSQAARTVGSPQRAVAAEDWISPRLDWENMSAPTQAELDTFASLVAQAASPIDDHRGTADYRRHAVGVMAKRALQRAFPGSVPSAH